MMFHNQALKCSLFWSAFVINDSFQVNWDNEIQFETKFQLCNKAFEDWFHVLPQNVLEPMREHVW